MTKSQLAFPGLLSHFLLPSHSLCILYTTLPFHDLHPCSSLSITFLFLPCWNINWITQDECFNANLFHGSVVADVSHTDSRQQFGLYSWHPSFFTPVLRPFIAHTPTSFCFCLMCSQKDNSSSCNQKYVCMEQAIGTHLCLEKSY